ncbi:MAG: agmatinase [Pseudomonadota bacterium]
MTMDYLSPDDGFLEPDRPDASDPDRARAVVIPFGLEASVSYGGGTAAGPSAILAASDQLELYDDELGYEPSTRFGIATVSEPGMPSTQAEALNTLESVVRPIVDAHRFPLILGGEHALTPGAIRPFLEQDPELIILQIDAHADLRDGYLGEHYSHASAMRRALDHPGVAVVGVGIRAISNAEVAYYNDNRDRVALHWAKDQASWNIDEIVAPLAGKRIYVTFDIDGLDSSIMPATGTPTPGGLGYWQALSIVRAASQVGQIVGGDVVELAPMPGHHAYDYTAASIAYKIISYALAD